MAVLGTGPVRRVSIQRFSLGGEATAEGSFLQSLLSGSLRFPVRVQGLAISLAPPSSRSLASTDSSAVQGSEPAAAGVPATAAPAAQAQAPPRRKLKLPLGLLQLVAVTLEDVTLQVEGLEIETRLQQASLVMQGAQALALTNLHVSLSQGAGVKQQLLQLDSFQLQHVHSAGPGLSWMHGPRWQLGRVTCSLGSVELAVQLKALEALLPRRPRRRAAEPAARPRASSEGPASKMQGLWVQRLIPQEVDFSLASISVGATASGLHAGSSLVGLSVRAMRTSGSTVFSTPSPTPAQQQQGLAEDSAAPALSAASGQEPDVPLAGLTASWQSFECSLSTAVLSSKQQPPQRQLAAGAPAAIALRCQGTDLSLQLEPAERAIPLSPTAIRSGGNGLTGQADGGHAVAGGSFGRLLLCVDSHINAMHTCVGHEAVPALLAVLGGLPHTRHSLQQPETNIEGGSAVPSGGRADLAAPQDAPNGPSLSAQSTEASPPALGHKGYKLPLQRLLSGLQLRLRLGQGSSLRFQDGSGNDRWVSSIEAVRLAVMLQRYEHEQLQHPFAAQGGSQPPSSSPDSRTSGSSGGASSDSSGWQHWYTQQLAVDFEVEQIQMHVASATEQQNEALQQILASRCVRVSLQPKPAKERHAVFLKGELSAAGTYAVLQHSALSSIAAIVTSLTPTSMVRGLDLSTSQQASAKATLQGQKRMEKSKAQLEAFAVSFTDLAVVLPHTSCVPTHHSLSGQGEAVQAAAALAIDSFAASVRPGNAVPEVQVAYLGVLYSEGRLSQTLPDSMQTLRAYHHQQQQQQQQEARLCHRLQLAKVQASLDADALLCAAGVAEGLVSIAALLPTRQRASGRIAPLPGPPGTTSAKQQPPGASPAVSSQPWGREACPAADAAVAGPADSSGNDGTSGSVGDPPDAVDIASLNQRRRSATGEAAASPLFGAAASGSGSPAAEGTVAQEGNNLPRTTSWLVEWDQCCMAVPLSDELGMALDLGPATAEWGHPKGAMSLQSAALSINGKAVLKWRQLTVGLQLPGGGPGGTLPLCPLPPASHLQSVTACQQGSVSGLESQAVGRGPPSAVEEVVPGSDELVFEADEEDGTIPAVLVPEGPFSSAAEGPGEGPAALRLAKDPSYEPYARARLHSWLAHADACNPEQAAAQQDMAGQAAGVVGGLAPSAAAAAGGPGAGTSDAATAGLGAGPCSLVDIRLVGFELCVPYDREPGPCQRYAEMYFKALGLAMQDTLLRLKAGTQRLKAGTQQGAGQLAQQAQQTSQRAMRSLFPMQLLLAAEDVVVRFEHHPLEKLAVQRQLWTDIATTVNPADISAPLHAALVQTSFASAAEAGHRAWEGVMGDLSQMYRMLVQQANLDAKGHERDLMHIKVEALRGLAVVCSGDEAGVTAALETIVAVDSASKDVTLIQARKVHADVMVDGFAMHLATCAQPFVSAADARVCGVLAVARQATAPPQQRERQLPVGAHRHVTIPVTLKGCRAPFKVYTDLTADLDGVTVSYSQGMEPTLMLVGMAGKRLAPTDPDKSQPRPLPIPWWDDLRYMWRGVVGVHATDFHFAMGLGLQPNVDETSQRMAVEANEVSGQLLSGDYSLAVRDLQATLFEAAGVDQPAGTLLVLPFASMPAAEFRLKLDWRLPKGRQPDQHHLFLAVPLEGQLQAPVMLAEEYKALSVDLTIEARLGEEPCPSLGLGVLAGGDPTAVGFLGDHQVQWMRSFVQALQKPPGYLRALLRRGTYFVRKPPAAVPKKGIPKLIQQLDVIVSASPINVVHFTVKSSDPSSAVCVSAANCAFAGCWLLNQPVPSFLHSPPHARGKRPVAALTRTVSKDFRVSAEDVGIHRYDAATADGPSGSAGLGGKLRRMSATAGDLGHIALGTRKGDLVSRPSLLNKLFYATNSATNSSAAQRCIGTAAQVGVTSAGGNPSLPDGPSEPSGRCSSNSVDGGGGGTACESRGSLDGGAGGPGGEPEDPPSVADLLEPHAKRPLKILIRDCKFLVDIAARNALWGVIDHLVNAFVSPPATQAVNAAAAAMLTPSPTIMSPSMSNWSSTVSPTTQMQRRRSSGGSMAPAKSEAMDGQNELLSLLLEQREAQGGDASLELPSPKDSQEVESCEEEEDEAPLSSPLDDAHSVLKYEIEVVNLQFNVEAEMAQGRFLLAAKSGLVAGSTLPDAPLNITTMRLEQVQAYVARTDIDPDASVAWLETSEGEFKAPDNNDLSSLRRVFNPIHIDMRHSKAPSAAARQRGGMGRSSTRRLSTPSTNLHGQQQLRGEELIFKVPEIIAVMDSREFEIMVDVIANVGMAQPPAMENVNAEAELLLEVEGDEVEDARQMYAIVRQQLASARQEVLQVRRCLGLRLVRSTGGVTGAGTSHQGGAELHSFVAEESDAQAAMHFNSAAELAVALREHLGATSAAAAATAKSQLLSRSSSLHARPSQQRQQRQDQGGARGSEAVAEGSSPREAAGLGSCSEELLPAAAGAACAAAAVAAADRELPVPEMAIGVNASSGGGSQRALLRQEQGLRGRQLLRAMQQQQALLLRWVEEQEVGGLQTFEKAKAALIELKAVARKRQSSRHASRVLLQVDRVVWQLCTLARDQLFVQASIRDLSMDIFRNKDRSGFTKFVIHRIEVMDSSGSLDAAPGIGPGVILSVWNPTKSWERDPMVRVNATMGVPTKTHIVYDLLDVTVHPLGLHLTEAIAVKFWEYFFPQEQDSAKRQSMFAQSVAVPASAAMRHRRAATAIPTEWDYSATGPPQSSLLAGKDRSVDSGGAGGSGSLAGGSGSSSPRAAAGAAAAAASSSGWRATHARLHRRSNSLHDPSSVTSSGAFSAPGLVEGHQSSSGEVPGGTSSFQGSAVAAAAAAAAAAGGVDVAAASLGRSRLSTADEGSSASTVPKVPHRKTRFVYVRVNRAHCRATYEGYPVSFNDLKFVSDSMVYEGLEGRWRDLFNRMKWDAIKSAVKSMAGLQGKKFKELLPEGYGEEGWEGRGEGRNRGKGHSLMASLGLAKSKKEEVGLSEEELREEAGVRLGQAKLEEAQQKRRMLFGEQHVARKGPPPAPLPPRVSASPVPPAAGGPPALLGAAAAPPAAVGPQPVRQPGAALLSPSEGASQPLLSHLSAATMGSEAAMEFEPGALERGLHLAAGHSGEIVGGSPPPSPPHGGHPEHRPFPQGELDAGPGPNTAQQQEQRGYGHGEWQEAAGPSYAAPAVPAGPLREGAAGLGLPGQATAPRGGTASLGEEAWPPQEPQHQRSRHTRHGSLGGLTTPKWMQHLAEKAEKGMRKLAK
ncbi:hypothetical protein N2152v2_005433 [Parachlorella kessleri]